ncbi:uncharacterized protein LOC116265969 [Nymphaea colorata]|uniref:Photosystem II reaction center X protein n=1 Tax=Nymphaea colorata TaxID=210225 RepID=A0A5K0YE83_9MAGN|nr:uncharacterized protein LOC116265969 [Nymphaea colorata]VVV75577.1 unnamed protein product [Nymphaea colorata]
MASATALSLALPVAAKQSSFCYRPSLPVRKAAAASFSGKRMAVVVASAEKQPEPKKGGEMVASRLTALALAAAMAVPEVAVAADSSLTPSLKNFLLSIVSGGVVVGVIIGAVIGVANFDPVKRS